MMTNVDVGVSEKSRGGASDDCSRFLEISGSVMAYLSIPSPLGSPSVFPMLFSSYKCVMSLSRRSSVRA